MELSKASAEMTEINLTLWFRSSSGPKLKLSTTRRNLQMGVPNQEKYIDAGKS